MEYHNIKFTAILGGNSNSINDVLDKLLLANAFLDTANTIHLVGEIGLVALHCLGFKVGKVQRSDNNIHEYDKLKEFF